jgi:hypothetical protein
MVTPFFDHEIITSEEKCLAAQHWPIYLNSIKATLFIFVIVMEC